MKELELLLPLVRKTKDGRMDRAKEAPLVCSICNGKAFGGVRGT